MKRQLELKADPKVKEKEVTGTVTLAVEGAEKPPEGAVLFIFARPKGVAGGPPLAVKRLTPGTFPQPFALSQLDVMMETASFDGELTLAARLDYDGDTKAGPGDIEGSLDVKAGDKNVNLALNHLIPKPASGAAAEVGRTITGEVKMDPKLERALTPNTVLFLFARKPDGNSGPPLAVLLLREVKLPHKFEMGQQNVIIAGGQFEGEMKIYARLDLDGNADTKKGDVQGHVSAKAGDKNITITLNQVIGE